MTCPKGLAITWKHKYPLEDFPDFLKANKVLINTSDVILGCRNILSLLLNLLFNVGLAPFTHSCVVARIVLLVVSIPMPHLSIRSLGFAPFQALLDVRAWILWWEVLASNYSACTLVSDITFGTDWLLLAPRILWYWLGFSLTSPLYFIIEFSWSQ